MSSTEVLVILKFQLSPIYSQNYHCRAHHGPLGDSSVLLESIKARRPVGMFYTEYDGDKMVGYPLVNIQKTIENDH